MSLCLSVSSCVSKVLADFFKLSASTLPKKEIKQAYLNHILYLNHVYEMQSWKCLEMKHRSLMLTDFFSFFLYICNI